MKTKLFNILTAITGIYMMVSHVLETGANTSATTLLLYAAATSLVSLVGTLIIVEFNTRQQNLAEAQLVEVLKKHSKV